MKIMKPNETRIHMHLLNGVAANYIILGLIAICLHKWAPSHSQLNYISLHEKLNVPENQF